MIKEVNKNTTIIQGYIQDKFTIMYESNNEKFYKNVVKVIRQSGIEDIIPIHVSEKLLTSKLKNVDTNTCVRISGEIRTRNYIDLADKHHTEVYLFVKSIYEETALPIDSEYIDINLVELEGYICRSSGLRLTPFGREICDITLAVNRRFGKSDYIPAIVWGRNARYIETLNIGDKVIIKGRFQSREYTKNNTIKVAFEISVSSIVKVEEEK